MRIEFKAFLEPKKGNIPSDIRTEKRSKNIFLLLRIEIVNRIVFERDFLFGYGHIRAILRNDLGTNLEY